MYFNRKIYSQLEKQIKNRKIIILTGSRQVGKSTLMKIIFEKVKKDSKAIFIDMDIPTNHYIGEKLENFIDYITLNGWDDKQKFFYVFLDEFQRVPGLDVVLKNIYDNYPNIKIFASGSSALTIKTKIKESLAGRKFIFEIYPLDFEEFLEFKDSKELKEYYQNLIKLKSNNFQLPVKLLKALNEFIRFGGYPEVVLSKKEDDKKEILRSIFDLYLEKDVMLASGIENLWAYKKIIQILAVNNGKLINYNELAGLAGIHNKTVRSYLALLEDTYLIKLIQPFSSNKYRETIKTPKIYFQDLGVRNYFLDNFNELEKRVDSGIIFENYILSELIKNKLKINFWRTKDKKEIDFIIEKNGKIIPVEVKIRTQGKSDDTRNLFDFMNLYAIQKGFVLSENFRKTIVKNKLKVSFKIAINFVNAILK